MQTSVESQFHTVQKAARATAANYGGWLDADDLAQETNIQIHNLPEKAKEELTPSLIYAMVRRLAYNMEIKELSETGQKVYSVGYVGNAIRNGILLVEDVFIADKVDIEMALYSLSTREQALIVRKYQQGATSLPRRDVESAIRKLVRRMNKRFITKEQ